MKENKHAFRLSKVNWIFVLIVIVISSFVFLRSDGINAASLGHLTGSWIGIGFIPLLFSVIVWLIRGRKRYAGTHTFNIVLAIMCYGIMKEMEAMSKERTDNIEKMTESLSTYKDEINNEEDIDSAYEKHMANVDESLSKIIQNTTGNEQEVYRNLQKFAAINNTVMVNWERSYDSVMEPRILDYAVLNDIAECEYQIAVLKRYQSQSEIYKDHFKRRMEIIKGLNKGIPEDNKALQGVIKGIKKKDSVQKPIFLPFINAHIDYSSNLIAIVAFLKKNKGKWQYLNEELIFDNGELDEDFSSLIEKITEDEDRIIEWTDKLIETM
ncbi:hypothetical protein ACFQ1M_11085 [Sungkyunkwania multivorans]|uniref:Uncharacterized protein n=1 Tax=Sungkyunkwania multivorans TaxID=1173618 RepID=A0ABW3CZI0_9FLAO